MNSRDRDCRGQGILIVRSADHTVLCEARPAVGFWRRATGLMGRRARPGGQTLLFRGCRTLHTFFMRFPLDVIFLDREDRVVKVVQGVGPWRIVDGGPHACHVIETPAGLPGLAKLRPGDALAMVPAAEPS